MSTATTAPAPTRRSSLRGRLVVVVAVVVALAAAYVASGSGERAGRLDPANPSPTGAQALAKVLERNGVALEVVRSAAAFDDADVAGATVVVTGTAALAPSTQRRLTEHVARAGDARLLLVDPAFTTVLDLDDDVQTDSDQQVRREAGCTEPVDLAGLGIEVDTATTFDGAPADAPTCFDGPRGPAYVVVDGAGAAGIELLGAGDALTNGQITRGDNAAVALRLLGRTDRVVWYVPDLADASSTETVTLRSLLPRAVVPSLWLLALATLAVLLWRVRRLGPLVAEPLPVVVRAVETARSRGRLYRRSGDRAHAAGLVREAARRDLADRLRLDPRADAASVAQAAAAHLERDPAELRQLLDDTTPPTSDRELVALTHQLARLRREARRR